MDYEQYKKEFSKAAAQSGYSEQNITRCLTYAEKLFSSNVPVIYNTSHLSALVGYKKNYLKRASVYTSFFYKEYNIKKRNGGTRTIYEPLPSLKEVQLWILNNILYKVLVSKYAKAYIPKGKITNNVVYHKAQPMVFAIDIENFFPSIKQESVEEIFKSLGYSNYVSNLLAKLCCLNNSLPQGAPTSPCLSNIYLKPVDDAISKFCTEREKVIRYTRYSDDMTFSGQFNPEEILAFVSAELTAKYLLINPAKIKLMTPNTQQIVTGIVVNMRPQVPFKKRNKLRQEIYYIKKHGIYNHMEKMKIKNRGYIDHILGQVNFILQINPEDKEFVEYKIFINSIKHTSSVVNS